MLRTQPTLWRESVMPPIHSNQMVSLDVVRLFTKVPTDETLAVVRDKLAADRLLEERTCIPIDNRMEMLTFCVETPDFGMGSDIYWQEEGLAMCSPLSLVLANIYMECFEEMALGCTSLKAISVAYICRWHSFFGLIRKMFRYYLITWTQSNHLYSSLWRKSKTTNYPSSMY